MNAEAVEALIEKVKSLTPEQRTEAEDFPDLLKATNHDQPEAVIYRTGIRRSHANRSAARGSGRIRARGAAEQF